MGKSTESLFDGRNGLKRLVVAVEEKGGGGEGRPEIRGRA